MKKETPSFLHDSNAHRDEKLLELRVECGYEGVGVYWTLIEHLREAKDLTLKKPSKGLALSLAIDLTRLTQIFDCCVRCGLFIVDNDGFASPALIDRIERYEASKEISRAHGKAGARKRWGKPDSPPIAPLLGDQKPPITLPIACITKTERELELEQELESKTEQKPKQKPPHVGLAAPWPDCPRVILSEVDIENFKMFLMREGLSPELKGPDAWTCAMHAQRHLEDHEDDTRIYSALTTFGIKEAHAKNQKRPRAGPSGNVDALKAKYLAEEAQEEARKQP